MCSTWMSFLLHIYLPRWAICSVQMSLVLHMRWALCSIWMGLVPHSYLPGWDMWSIWMSLVSHIRWANAPYNVIFIDLFLLVMYIFKDYFGKRGDIMVDFSGYHVGWEQYSFLNLCVLFTEILYLIRVLFSDLETETKTTNDVESCGDSTF